MSTVSVAALVRRDATRGGGREVKFPPLCQQAAFEAAGLKYQFAPCYFAPVTIFCVKNFGRFGFDRWLICAFPGHPGHECTFGLN